jgi:heme-degrading monooxygenase HmoA
MIILVSYTKGDCEKMHILIINFNLQEMSQAQYLEVCDEVATAFADIPGLISKKWLANEETNTYGGVYLWEDKQSMLDYKGSEIFKQLADTPAFVNVTATDFDLLAGPSKITRAIS